MSLTSIRCCLLRRKSRCDRCRSKRLRPKYRPPDNCQLSVVVMSRSLVRGVAIFSVVPNQAIVERLQTDPEDLGGAHLVAVGKIQRLEDELSLDFVQRLADAQFEMRPLAAGAPD